MPRTSRRRRSQPRREGPRGAISAWLSRHAQNLVGTLGRLYRQPVASLLTLLVIGIALALPAGLHIVVTNGRHLVGGWESVADLSVYLRPEETAETADRLAAALEAEETVASVQTIHADEALAEFREQSGFGAALDALTDNPLPNVLVVRPVSGAEPATIETLAETIRAREEVDMVQADTEWVSRFQGLLDIVRRGVIMAAVVLAAGVIIIVGNTIRLDIQNKRDEIEVSKLVGASDAFIRRPFLYTGLWYGLGGGLVALIVVHAGLLWLAEPVRTVAGLYGSEFRLRGLDPTAALALLGGGAALGWLGSWLASTRHLRQIEPGHDL